MSKAYCFWMYGMWGPVTDPGSCQMSGRIKNELGLEVMESPYRDYEVNAIVEQILKLPLSVPVLVGGTSLGSNNTPIVAAYVYARNPKRIVHGIWGFQASIWGAKAGIEPDYKGITSNVKFAHLTTSDNPINAGLGAYRWVKAPANSITNYINPTINDVHPGDGNVEVQNAYLAEMKRVVAAAQ